MPVLRRGPARGIKAHAPTPGRKLFGAGPGSGFVSGRSAHRAKEGFLKIANRAAGRAMESWRMRGAGPRETHIPSPYDYFTGQRRMNFAQAMSEHREELMQKEFQGIMKNMNHDGLMERDRETLSAREKEIYDLRNLALQALEMAARTGKLRGFRSREEFRKYFEGFLGNWLAEYQGPQAAAYAGTAAKKFFATLYGSKAGEEAFRRRFGRLVFIAGGGDPSD